jgi:predicted HicB family RNase H-like nuclease
MEVKTRVKNVVVNVRMPPDLKERIKALADKKQWSINKYIVNRLIEDTKPR